MGKLPPEPIRYKQKWKVLVVYKVSDTSVFEKEIERLLNENWEIAGTMENCVLLKKLCNDTFN
jgi:hypothetical protein